MTDKSRNGGANNENRRTEKVSPKEIASFEYNEDGFLNEEIRNGTHIEYLYNLDYLFGFVLDGVMYYFDKDDSLTVTSILDVSGNKLASYQYGDDGLVSAILGPNENGSWVDKSDDDTFIGVINRIRLHSFYADPETTLYYNGLRYYDSVLDQYVGAEYELSDVDTAYKAHAMADSLLWDVAFPAIMQEAMIQSTAANDQLVQQLLDWVFQLMSSSTFGAPINTHSTTWYSGLSEVELLTRLIYGENTYYVQDQTAVAWVLANRKSANSTTFYTGTNSYANIAKKSGQFAPITGGSSDTQNARVPNTSSGKWASATTLACSLLITSSTSDYQTLFPKPDGISTQKYFLGLSYALSIASFRDKANGGLEYNFGTSTYQTLKLVTVVFESASSLKNPTNQAAIKAHSGLTTVAERNKHNIFFDY